MEHIFRPALWDSHIQALQTSADASNCAVVIGPLLIDDSFEASLPFVVMVGDVWHEIGVATLSFAHDPVFVITEVSRA